MSEISFEASNITPNGSKKNSYIVSGDAIVDLLNLAADEELYDSSVLSQVQATLSMTYFEANGNIIITIENTSSSASIIIGVTFDYYDGVGKVAFSTSASGISRVITYTRDAAGGERLEDVTTISGGNEQIVMSMIMESKGEAYEIPEGTDHKSCDAEIYEATIKQGNKNLVTVKLNAGQIGNTVRGYIDMFIGEEAPDTGMGGIDFLSASSDTSVKGTFDIVTENEEIISAVANFDMEYYLISGNVSLIYNAQDLKEAGKTPVSITVRDNNLTTYITLDTASYEAGQGVYTLTVTEPEGTLTANISLPAVKNFELTEREQLYLDRADSYLNKISEVEIEGAAWHRRKKLYKQVG